MADDLGRWLIGEPIRARRFGPGERAVKWARRRPAVAALLAALALTLVGALAGGVLFMLKLDRARRDADDRAHGEALAHQAADKAADEAHRANRRTEALLYDIRMPTALALIQEHHTFQSSDWAQELTQLHEDQSDQAETLLDNYLGSDLRGWEWGVSEKSLPPATQLGRRLLHRRLVSRRQAARHGDAVGGPGAPARRGGRDRYVAHSR